MKTANTRSLYVDTNPSGAQLDNCAGYIAIVIYYALIFYKCCSFFFLYNMM